MDVLKIIKAPICPQATTVAAMERKDCHGRRRLQLQASSGTVGFGGKKDFFSRGYAGRRVMRVAGGQRGVTASAHDNDAVSLATFCGPNLRDGVAALRDVPPRLQPELGGALAEVDRGAGVWCREALAGMRKGGTRGRELGDARGEREREIGRASCRERV